MTVEELDSIKPVLLETVNQIEELQLDLQGITEIDLFGTQLLYSFHQTCTQAQKRLSVKEPASLEIITLVQELGFSHNTWLCFEK